MITLPLFALLLLSCPPSPLLFSSASSTSDTCSSSHTPPLSHIQIITPNYISCFNTSSSPPSPPPIIRIGASISSYYKDIFYMQSLQLLNGWKMFIEWVNYERHGFVLNNQTYFFEFIYIEDYSKPHTVMDITEYLIQMYQINFMFAPYSTPLTAACSLITENQNISLFSSGAHLPLVFENTDYVYGLLPAASTYSEGAFRAFSHLGAHSIAVIADDDVTVCNKNSSIQYAEIYNLTLYNFYSVNSSHDSYNQTIKDILIELKDQNVETVFACSFTNLCELIILYAKQIDYNPFGIMLSLCIINPSLLELGEDLSYVFALAPWASTSKIYDQYTNWTAVEFETRYETTFGSTPTYLSAASFASGEILLASIEATNTINSSVLQQHILNSFYPTLYGNISFNSIGQSSNDMFVVQVMPGTHHPEIVLPDSYADISPYFPVPSWSKRKCQIDTNYCSSHGTCSSAGVCICDYGYYGFENVNSCDTYCVGTFDPETGGCAKFTTYYVGVILDYQFPEFSEYLAHIALAAEMINNKTDGWFDDILNVHLILNASDSACDSGVASEASKKLNHWANVVNNNPMDGMIGGYCSSASAGAAIHNNEYAITQVSYGSTAVSLSNKDLYEYFTRTCGSDSTQGPALAKTLQSLGIVPFIAIVQTEDEYSVSLSNSFATSYESSGNTILLSFSYNIRTATAATYSTMVDELAKSGSPVILLVVYQDEIANIINAASSHPVFSSTEILWIGVDAWTDVTVNTPNLPSGVIGIAPNRFNGNITDRYLEVWRNLDPSEYPDSDSNRNDVAAYSLQAADAVFALASAYEISLHDSTGLTGMSLRTYIFSSLVGQVSFEGVSGDIDFSASGDLVNPIFRIMRYQGYESKNQWEEVGKVDSSGLDENFDYSKLIWPDGSNGVTSSYSNQLVPYCGAGEEPIVASDGISTCTPCEVGYYKPSPGRNRCMECPEGADCNDVGIIIPCILKGYWRAQPPNSEELANFKKYPIYTCDFSIVCLGGCQLNQTCKHDRKQSSPVCGVCEDNYFMSDGECYACSSNQSGTQTVQTIVYILVAIGSLFLLFSILAFTITFNLASTRQSTSEMEGSLSESENLEMRPRKTTATADFRRKSLATIQTMSRSVSKTIFTPAIALLTHQENQRKVKKVIKGSGMTAKITLSFLQVMTGSFYMLNLDLPSYFKVFFNAIRINPFRSIQASFSCEDQSSNYLLHPYYVGTIFCVLIPLMFIVLLILAAFFAWKVFLWTGGNNASQGEQNRQWKRLRDLTVKMYFWFCLISYPPLSHRILSYFNCRDLGLTGNFLRADYTVSCESTSYQLFFFIAIFGTFLVPVGVPVLFSLAVHYRKHPLLLNPTLLLHDNFVTEWRYFEAYDLIRKLTLTSLVVYVAPPDTASQCLFLLLVDGTALLLLAYSRPYANGNDDFLSGVLVSIECISFFVATVVVSGIATQDNYNLHLLYNTLFALILLSMACIVPWTLGLKFKAVSTRVDRILDMILQKSEDYGLPLPALTRLDSRRRMLHEVEEMKETMHDIRSSLSDLAHIELMYKDPDDDDADHYPSSTFSPVRPLSTASIGSTNGTSKNPIHSTSLTKNPKEVLMIKLRDSERRRAPPLHDLEIVRESDEISSSAPSAYQEFFSDDYPSQLPPPIPSFPSHVSPSSFHSHLNPPPPASHQESDAENHL